MFNKPVCPKNGFSKGLVPRSCHKSKIWVQERASPKVMSQVQIIGKNNEKNSDTFSAPMSDLYPCFQTRVRIMKKPMPHFQHPCLSGTYDF